ncbi:hypothetical protein M378DRAFT_383059 [Amanita muscaria Koide BX008]|uniref:DUF6534 domain-containing protein n=1 Tax=Amanita muscaria (strain Koide BX008) TaxID=946122 RepID=A0A0C2WLB1_AMAMK|nr:hypothetical protein M378DRAFT_383059 [Amanita muscaria Koide BX008]
MDVTSVTTLGSVLLGSLVATFLSGMNTLQTILYVRLYPEDTIRIKALVATIMSLDIIHTAFIWVSLWFFFIENFGQKPDIRLEQNPEFLPGLMVVTAITTLVAHMFYLHRIISLSHQNIWIAIPVVILALCRVGSGIATIAGVFKFQDLSEYLAGSYQVRWVLFLGLVFAAATDLAIMTTIIVLLWLGRRQTISLGKALDRLVLYTFEAGMLTTFTAIATMIAWLAQEHAFIFMAIYLSLAKVYTTGLLGSLNLRYQLRHDQNPQTSQDWNMTNVGDTPMMSRGLSDIEFHRRTTMTQVNETDTVLFV